MFRLSRHKTERSSGERVECKLSSFQAFQVPRGWDKLFLSVVSMETGKTIAKSSKAVVYGGTCQWTESFSETIWVYQDDLSKEFEECLYKISVAMGSARSGILGELILNLTDYMKSRDSGPISLPLKKCNYGTILQIKIQCYPKTKSRDRNTWKEPAHRQEDLHSNDEDKDNRSDGSDTMLAKSLASSSGSHLGVTSSGDQIGIKNGVKAHTTEPHDVEQPLNLVNDMQHLGADQHDKPYHPENSQVGKEVDLKSKIHTLENELAQALETSNMYKVQLTSILIEQQNNDAAIPKETVASNDPNIDNNSRIASLEVELKEMQERYLHMSLQYAEVEASREELVMQLKSSQKGGKRWFS